eukprot:2310133-Pyramimonas_sp.AAC.1
MQAWLKGGPLYDGIIRDLDALAVHPDTMTHIRSLQDSLDVDDYWKFFKLAFESRQRSISLDILGRLEEVRAPALPVYVRNTNMLAHDFKQLITLPKRCGTH